MKRLSREAIAERDIGITIISPRSAFILIACFLIIICTVPAVQFVLDKKNERLPQFSSLKHDTGGSFMRQIKEANKQVLKNISDIENYLEDQSFLRSFLLPPLQFLFVRYLGYGNEKVVVGKEGQLLYRPAVDFITGPPFLSEQYQLSRSESHEPWEEPEFPDALKAIIEFRDQLATRGIELVVMPVPVKAAVEPSILVDKRFGGPLVNRSWDLFVDRLMDHGIQLFDARPLLYDFYRQGKTPYLATDTHWSPEAMGFIASELGSFLVDQYSELRGNTEYVHQFFKVSGAGDISRMLVLPEKFPLFPLVEVVVDQVITERGEFWQPDQNSPVLLLGDSFTNIYSTPGLGFGFAAGLAEQLSFHLHQPIDILARNDDGAYVSREMLSTELARGRDRLKGKRVVIWEFSERELSFGNWKPVNLLLGDPDQTGFFTVQEGSGPFRVTGTVASISRSPQPGSVPYRDNVITIHLVDITGTGVTGENNQALVYALGMYDNEVVSSTRVRPGDRISVILTSWQENENEFGGYRRTPLDDEMLELELPNWGVIDEKTDD